MTDPKDQQQGCEIRTTSSGEPVRVNGQISQERLDELAGWVKSYVDSRCAVDSDKPMPAIAQRMHGRENYSCGRERGHEGPHRWPDVGHEPAIVEWDEKPSCTCGSPDAFSLNPAEVLVHRVDEPCYIAEASR
jgi:hypothetical protein